MNKEREESKCSVINWPHTVKGEGVSKVIFPKARPALINLLHVRICRNIIKCGHDNSFRELLFERIRDA